MRPLYAVCGIGLIERVAVDAVGLCPKGLDPPASMTALPVTISAVVRRCSNKEVIGTDAGGVIAVVAGEQPFGDVLAVGENPGESVRLDDQSLLAKVDDSVAINEDEVPIPAAVRDIDVAPEPLQETRRSVENLHAPILTQTRAESRIFFLNCDG
jgi:hypothetical protein